MNRTTALLLVLLLVPALVRAEQPLFAFNCGGPSVVDSDGVVFAADAPYQPGGGGYVGGTAFTPSYANYSAPWSSRDPALHSRQRLGMSAYRFDVPAGEYALSLYWLDGTAHGPRLRLMDVRIEGELVFDDLDLSQVTGFMRAWEVCVPVSVTDGTLDVEFTAVRGSCILSAVAVRPAHDSGLAPFPPGGFDLRDGYGMNILRWNPPANYTLAGIRVYRAISAGGPFSLIAELPYRLERYYDREALTGQQYHYRLTAVDLWGRESAPTVAMASVARNWTQSTLPVFRLSMAQADYDSLNAHPFQDVYYPANWGVGEGPLYSIDVHYRGGMARFFEKKSWKLELSGQLEYNGWQDLFVISNPDDRFVIQNDVSLRVFDVLSPWSSESQFIHLELHNEYAGVYQLVEKVDEDFLTRRGETVIGNLYKADSDFRALGSPGIYALFYPKSAGPDDSYQDLIDFIEELDDADPFEMPLLLGARLDLENFYEYYAMMIYTRQLDFIVRNYYLYHDPDTGLWSFIPWDMNICFYWDDLPLDFGTHASPHFWDGSWNRLYDAVLSVPRLRWDYAKRLGELNATVMNHDQLASMVDGIYDGIETDVLRDVYKAYHDLNDDVEAAAELVKYRMEERDAQLESMLPAFKSEIPTVCINEHQAWPGGIAAEGGRNQYSPWVELYNFGDMPVFLGTLALSPDETPGNGAVLPSLFLGTHEHVVLYLDDRPDLGVKHLPILPDSAGGSWVLVGTDGKVWDRIRYAAGNTMLSEGRQPDGWVSWHFMPLTPGRENSPHGAPLIQEAEFTPAQPLASDSLRITVRALDPGGRPLDLSFHWKLAGGPVDSLRLREIRAGSWSGVLAPRGSGGLLTWWVSARNDLAIEMRDPPGAPYYTHAAMILDDSAAIFLNEFMADNDTTITDPSGAHEDWIEIYNGSGSAVDLAGFSLTDNLAIPGMWQFPANPACILAPGAWLLVWADQDPQEGPLHANFKLNKDGEELGLFLPDGSPLDLIQFGFQPRDVSFGRGEDGGEPWDFLAFASPGASNEVPPPTGPAGDPPAALALEAWPNPFNPEVRFNFELPRSGRLRLEIFGVDGRHVRMLLEGEAAAGPGNAVWRGEDDSGRALASGLYFARLRVDDLSVTRKVLLIK